MGSRPDMGSKWDTGCQRVRTSVLKATAMKSNPIHRTLFELVLLTMVGSSLLGCYATGGPTSDRPFPIGQVSDSHWETQQTNAEAADFIVHLHEFVEETAKLAPGTKDHLEQIALRLEHVPFPVVIERYPHRRWPELDEARRRIIVESLARMGVPDAEHRVVIAPSFAEGFTAREGEQAYNQVFGSNFSGGSGFGGGGFGGISGGFGGGGVGGAIGGGGVIGY